MTPDSFETQQLFRQTLVAMRVMVIVSWTMFVFACGVLVYLYKVKR